MKRIICLILSILFILSPICSFAIFDENEIVPVWNKNVVETLFF